MQDRIPKFPGRVELVPVEGQANVYDLIRRDQPTQTGTALNKGTLLDDETCSFIGLPSSATPNEAFLKLGLGAGMFAYAVTVKVSGIPAPGVTISGLSLLAGGAATTNASGYVLGVSPSKNPTLSITSPYIDVSNYSSSFASNGTITAVAINMSLNGITSKTFTTSGSIRFSPAVSRGDFCIVGGGGSGAAIISHQDNKGGATAGGGAGGYVLNVLNLSVANSNYAVSVGSRGEPAVAASPVSVIYASPVLSPGKSGGASSVSGVGSASGGQGGGASIEYQTPGGSGGSGGGSGVNFRFPWMNIDMYVFGAKDGGNAYNESHPSTTVGTGQRTTTKAFGSGILYSSGGNGVRFGTGAGTTGGGSSSWEDSRTKPTVTAGDGINYGDGGGAAALMTQDGAAGNYKATSGAGHQGAVLTRWRYK